MSKANRGEVSLGYRSAPLQGVKPLRGCSRSHEKSGRTINAVSEAKFIRQLGAAPPDLFDQVIETVELWLGIRP